MVLFVFNVLRSLSLLHNMLPVAVGAFIVGRLNSVLVCPPRPETIVSFTCDGPIFLLHVMIHCLFYMLWLMIILFDDFVIICQFFACIVCLYSLLV